MNIRDNAYIGLLNIIRREGRKSISSSICLGRVVMQTPLTIKIGELALNINDVLIADTVNSLNQGDTLAMVLAPNKQKYIILCKVVSL